MALLSTFSINTETDLSFLTIIQAAIGDECSFIGIFPNVHHQLVRKSETFSLLFTNTRLLSKVL